MKLTEIKNKTVFLKTDFNLPSPKDTARIEASLDTIALLLKNGNKIIIATHWGRPDGQKLPEFSTQKLVKTIENCLKNKGLTQNLEFIDQFEMDFEKVREKIENSKNQIFLLQNVRFDENEDGKNEEKREKLAKNYASLAQTMVDEAFSLSHRKEVTNSDIKKFLDAVFGLNYESEVKILGALKNSAKRPFLVIMGGAKLETKLGLVEKMLEKCDKILLGGQICFTFIEGKKRLDKNYKIDIKNSLVEESFLPKAKEILQKFGEKIVLPVDFNFNEDGEFENKPYAGDVGEKTVEIFKKEILAAKSVFWNGPLGQQEIKEFAKSTIELAKCLANTEIKVIVGGGDTVSGIDSELLKKLYFVSTGGGATLDFLSK